MATGYIEHCRTYLNHLDAELAGASSSAERDRLRRLRHEFEAALVAYEDLYDPRFPSSDEDKFWAFGDLAAAHDALGAPPSL